MKRQKQVSACPMDALLRLLMGPWTTYVLWVLSTNGPTRFGELKRRVPGVSAKVLTDRLRMLVDSGIIYRRYEPTIPPKVTYGLAPRGEELREVLDGLNHVAQRWHMADEAPLSTATPANANEGRGRVGMIDSEAPAAVAGGEGRRGSNGAGQRVARG